MFLFVPGTGQKNLVMAYLSSCEGHYWLHILPSNTTHTSRLQFSYVEFLK